ncbi:MAG TPA: hypothetical protein VEB40_07535 [Flavipsychrobacter sp.]|nr:hypothetical protein [Flavipsychrobacter sp.]
MRYFLISLLLTFSSCAIVDTPGFYSGYKKLSPAEKEKVVFATDTENVCIFTTSDKVYAVTAAQLVACLRNNDTSVVYIWSPHCHSDICISISAADHYCKKNNYSLYVIMEYYDLPKMTVQKADDVPMYAINHIYYGTDYCNAYQKRFVNDLAKDRELSKEERYDRFMFFKKDRLVFTRRSITGE